MSIRNLSEFIGTAGLLIEVVGSGIMGENLFQGNVAVALIANSIATGAGLYALIQTFRPISGGIVGVFVTHAMFGQKILQLSNHDRSQFRFYFSELIATFGLITVIFLCGKRSPKVTPSAVALYITAAYWCTSSTSFANPALTTARSLTDTIMGIQCTGTF